MDYRIDNAGRKIFTAEARIDCVRRSPATVEGGADVVRDAECKGPKGPKGLQEEPEESEAVARNAAEPDVVRARYRLLSAAPAWPSLGDVGPQLVDYGHNDGAALRETVGLINSRRRPVPLMWNHSMDMRDRAGRIENAEWEDETDIPAGVNGDLVVRRSFDRRAAVGIETGEIDATSISVRFELTPSHEGMAFREFIASQGETVNGDTVRWLPLGAIEVVHHAMVPAGADEYSGPRVNHAATADNIRSHAMTDAMQALAAVVKAVGVDAAMDRDVPEGLVEMVQARMDKLVGLHDRYNELAQGLQKLQRFVDGGDGPLSATTILERLPERLDLAAHGERYVNDLRAQALKWFDSAKADPASPEYPESARQLRNIISSCSSVDQLAAYIDEYKTQAEARFGEARTRRTTDGADLPVERGLAARGNPDIASGVAKLFTKEGV